METSDPIPETAQPVVKPKRIILVDVEPDLVRRIKLHLERNGYLVETAESGAQALVLIEANRPNLLITGSMIPEMDGYELMKAVRSDIAPVELPVILFGFTDPNDGSLLPIPYPPDRVILKPCNLAQLAELVFIVNDMLSGSPAKDKL